MIAERPREQQGPIHRDLRERSLSQLVLRPEAAVRLVTTQMWFSHLGVKGEALGIFGSAFVLANYPRPTHTITPAIRHAQLSVLSTSRQTGLPQNGRPSAIPRLDYRDTVRCKLEPKWHRHERLKHARVLARLVSR